MVEKPIKWTEQQKRAIAARGSDILVTASAGTGKTAVLSGRCVDIVRDKSMCPDVWSILVLTFTDMAAEQMRSRIAEQLRAAFLKNGDPHLRYQLMLLQGADISTIHSFCKRLITEYFYKLSLDPTFTVIDSDEARLLKTEVLEKTIDWAWEQSNLHQPLRQLLGRRDLRTNDGFLSKIIDLSDFLDSVVSRENWYERAFFLTEAANPFATELGNKQKQIIAEKLQHILNQLRHAQKLYENECADGDWAGKSKQTHIKPVEQCTELLEAGEWDKCVDAIRNFDKPATYKPKGLREPIAELIQNTARRAVEDFKGLSQLAIINPDYLGRLGSSVGLQTRVLVELVKKFDQLYSQTKRVVNCLDFADLEHYALKLLTRDLDTEDELLPSEAALALRRKYKYIFVDEYQDINPVQQAILDAVSSDGNVFVVGDVKQSIYAWRGAEPEIFLEHLKPTSVDPANVSGGLRVDLNVNFRSAKGILDFVNKIFSRIMTTSLAKIDYDELARLRPSEVEEEAAGDEKSVVELHILDGTPLRDVLRNGNLDEQGEDGSASNDENINVVSSRQRQAALIAQCIRQIVGAETGKPEFQIYDKELKCLRGVEYRDIVILMRSLAKKANDYVEVLQFAGVPVSCQGSAGYFEATEISDCLCLLKVLDNPQRDIELAAVLRSPLFKISDTELAKIKIHSEPEDPPNEHNKNFYDCVLRYCASGPDARLRCKLNRVVTTIERWRTLARRGSLADLVWQIYRQTGFLSFVSALPSGRARRANLLKLHDRAIQFEGFASSVGPPRAGSLTRFVEFIEKLQEVGEDWAPAEPEAAAGNAVRILSVHKSKGLEFPVVFLAELDSEFSKKDTKQDCLVDDRCGIGLRIIDDQSNTRLDSIAYQVIERQRKEKALAEEMRILYVATTRARDRLILSACEKLNHCQQIISSGFLLGGETVADWQLRICRSPLEWILYGLCDQKNLHDVFETGLVIQAIDKNLSDDSQDLFNLKVYRQAELEQLSGYVRNLRNNKLSRPVSDVKKSRTKRGESKLLSDVKKSLSWRYGHGDAVMLPAKQSVTQLTHRNDEYVKFDYSRALGRKPSAVITAEAGLIEPQGQLLGTATHLVISQLELVRHRRINKVAIEEVIGKLMANGAITETIAKQIDKESIVVFFRSELGRKVLAPENEVLREWPFTFTLPASFPAAARSAVTSVARVTGHGSQVKDDETVIIQGIIDMLVRTLEGLLVIDFKIDTITTKEVPERAELYRKQLELYGKAAAAILKNKLLGKWLYFLTPGCAIEVG